MGEKSVVGIDLVGIKNFKDAFSFMMANRHKQNEAIRKMNEQEAMSHIGILEHEPQFKPSMPEEVEEDDSNPVIIDCISSKQTPSESCGKTTQQKSATCLNAFELLMSKRKSEKHHHQDRNILDSDKADDIAEICTNTSPGKREKHHQDRNILDSDEADDIAEICTNTPPVLETLIIEKNVQTNVITPTCSDTSPTTLKLGLNLINDNDELDFEETFKEEIWACGFSKNKAKSFKKPGVVKSKGNKLPANKKTESSNKIIANEEFINPKKVVLCNNNTCQQDTNCNADKSQLSIERYFLQPSVKKFKPDDNRTELSDKTDSFMSPLSYDDGTDSQIKLSGSCDAINASDGDNIHSSNALVTGENIHGMNISELKGNDNMSQCNTSNLRTAKSTVSTLKSSWPTRASILRSIRVNKNKPVEEKVATEKLPNYNKQNFQEKLTMELCEITVAEKSTEAISVEYNNHKMQDKSVDCSKKFREIVLVEPNNKRPEPSISLEKGEVVSIKKALEPKNRRCNRKPIDPNNKTQRKKLIEQNNKTKGKMPIKLNNKFEGKGSIEQNNKIEGKLPIELNNETEGKVPIEQNYIIKETRSVDQDNKIQEKSSVQQNNKLQEKEAVKRNKKLKITNEVKQNNKPHIKSMNKKTIQRERVKQNCISTLHNKSDSRPENNADENENSNIAGHFSVDLDNSCSISYPVDLDNSCNISYPNNSRNDCETSSGDAIRIDTESNSDESAGLRRSSRSIKKPRVYDPSMDDFKSPKAKSIRVKGKVHKGLLESAKVKSKKNSEDPEQIVLCSDDDDECWEIFRKKSRSSKNRKQRLSAATENWLLAAAKNPSAAAVKKKSSTAIKIKLSAAVKNKPSAPANNGSSDATKRRSFSYSKNSSSCSRIKKQDTSTASKKDSKERIAESHSDDETSVETITLDQSFEKTNSSAKSEDEEPEIITALAPIFQKKKAPAKEDIEKQRAREDFLFSESPVEFSDSKQAKCEEEVDWIPFPAYSHTRQKTEDPWWHLADPKIPQLLNNDCLSYIITGAIEWDKISSSPFTATSISENDISQTPALNASQMCHILAHLSDSCPSLPLFSLFKNLLKRKKEALTLYHKELRKISETEILEVNENSTLSPSNKVKRKRRNKSTGRNTRRKLNDGAKIEPDIQELPLWQQWNPYSWVQIFAPSTSELFLGNLDCLKIIKSWLLYWKDRSESAEKSAANGLEKNYAGDSSDTESSDGNKPSNTMLLVGPPGVGKTAAVYALAQQLGYKVLEINASSQRPGKQIMLQLSEATQSHTVSSNHSLSLLPQGQQVDKSDSAKCFISASGESKGTGNKENKSKLDILSSSENSKIMALILIEDIDVVYDDSDDGFLSAINTLMTCTKRPIVLTLNCESKLAEAALRGRYSTAYFSRPNPDTIARYLQVMGLVDGIFVDIDALKKLAETNSSDIRRSVLDLQFWLISGPNSVKMLLLENTITDGDKYTSYPLFSNVTLEHSAEIPVAHGCLSLRPAVEEKLSCSMAWTLVSKNYPSILPFPHKPKLKRLKKYPLKDDDPLVEMAILCQQFYSDFSEYNSPWKEKLPNEGAEPCAVNKKQISEKGNVVVGHSLKHLSGFLSTLGDLDILSTCSVKVSKSETNIESCFAHLYPGLETPVNEYSFYSSVLSQEEELVQEISFYNLRYAQKEIGRLVTGRADDEGILSVETEPSSLLLNPHSIPNVSDRMQFGKIENGLCELISPPAQIVRDSLYLHYFPYLREIVRACQLLEAVCKRTKRSNNRSLRQLNRYVRESLLTPEQISDLCNAFDISES